jgi:hypothetical protein
MLMDSLKSREKAREQDKWLSLAQVGMAMMASQSPTLAGAFGEAGLKGAEAYKKSRDQYDTDRMNIMGELEQYKQQRAAAQARASGGGKPPPISSLTALMKERDDVSAQLQGLGGIPEPGWFGSSEDPNAIARSQLADRLSRVEAALSYVSQANGIPMYYGDVPSELPDMSDPTP